MLSASSPFVISGLVVVVVAGAAVVVLAASSLDELHPAATNATSTAARSARQIMRTCWR